MDETEAIGQKGSGKDSVASPSNEGLHSFGLKIISKESGM